MRSAVSEIQAILTMANVKTEDRPDMTHLLVGEAVGNVLAVPSSPIEEPISFFRLNHRERVLECLSEINELLVIDIDAALEIAYKLWVTRYRLVHEPGSAVTKRLMGLIIREGGYQIPPRMAAVAQQYPTAVAHSFMIDCFKEDGDDSGE